MFGPGYRMVDTSIHQKTHHTTYTDISLVQQKTSEMQMTSVYNGKILIGEVTDSIYTESLPQNAQYTSTPFTDDPHTDDNSHTASKSHRQDTMYTRRDDIQLSVEHRMAMTTQRLQSRGSDRTDTHSQLIVS